MSESVNNNREVVAVYGFKPEDSRLPELRPIPVAQSTIASAASQNKSKASFAVIAPIKAFFAKIIAGLWSAFNKLRDLFWEVKIDMHMAGVEGAQLNEHVAVFNEPIVPLAGQADPELPNVLYTTERFDLVIQHLNEARQAGVGHPAQTKLMALRGACYNSLYEPTQKKLVRLVHAQIKDPSLKTFKDCLLNEPFWALFSNSVERMYLQHSIPLLLKFHQEVQQKAVPFKTKEIKGEFDKLTKRDQELFIKAIGGAIGGWKGKVAMKFIWQGAIEKDGDKDRALTALEAYITAQKTKLREIIPSSVELGA